MWQNGWLHSIFPSCQKDFYQDLQKYYCLVIFDARTTTMWCLCVYDPSNIFPVSCGISWSNMALVSEWNCMCVCVCVYVCVHVCVCVCVWERERESSCLLDFWVNINSKVSVGFSLCQLGMSNWLLFVSVFCLLYYIHCRGLYLIPCWKMLCCCCSCFVCLVFVNWNL